MTYSNSFFESINSNSYLFCYIFTDFIKKINIFLFSEFAQLSLVGNNTLYTLLVDIFFVVKYIKNQFVRNL